MGCDIHSYAEKRNKNTGKWEKVTGQFSLDSYYKKLYKKEKGDSPFNWRSYSMFAFLAGVRNYDYCEPISEPKDFPNDASPEVTESYEKWFGDAHSTSWLTAKELLNFNYDKKFWNRRVTKQLSENHWTGAGIAEEGEGVTLTYRENLGEDFFVHLKELEEIGNPEDVFVPKFITI